MDSLDEEKRFYERFWTLLRDPMLMRIFERHGPEAFRRSSVLEGFEAFIKDNNFCGGTCVEIGTFNGLTAFVLARYFDRVVSIDVTDRALKRKLWHELGAWNVEFINVADNAGKAAIVRGMDFDAAYVDGDHTHDTETDFALVKRCGRVLFHEHWDAQPAVQRLVETLRPKALTRDKWALWIA